MSDSDRLPRGLVFASLEGDNTGRAWRRTVVVGVVILATLALTWPVYPFFSAAQPYVLGLPLSLAWVVGWLAVVFVTLAAVYWVEEVTPGDPSPIAKRSSKQRRASEQCAPG
jgi:hypothetical protein